MHESDVRRLANLFERRQKITAAIQYCTPTDAFTKAAQEQFNGSGTNSIIRDLCGGALDMGAMFKRAAVEHLTERLHETDEEIKEAGGEL